jgi:hypothetical protein
VVRRERRPASYEPSICVGGPPQKAVPTKAKSTKSRKALAGRSRLEVEGGELVEEADEGGELAGGELTTEFGVDGAALLNEEGAVEMAFRSKLEKESSSGRRFFFGDEFFADEGFDGAVDDGAVETEERGDLILVEGGTAAEGGENEAAGLRALRFLFHAAGDVEIGGGEVDEDGVLEDFFGNEFLVSEDHRKVTVDSRGRRHCG